MVPKADNGRVFALLIIGGLLLVGLLAIRYGADSRPDEHERPRANL
jgi:hypothetical protein